jgi:hypothetical protein
MSRTLANIPFFRSSIPQFSQVFDQFVRISIRFIDLLLADSSNEMDRAEAIEGFGRFSGDGAHDSLP